MQVESLYLCLHEGKLLSFEEPGNRFCLFSVSKQ